MRSSLCASILAFPWLASAISFINPPPPFGDINDFTSNPVYTEGSAITVVWTDTKDTNIPFSVVVYQVDYSNNEVKIPANQNFEYVVRNINRTSSPWIVATAKDLSFSNIFVLTVFFQGDTVGRALSHWFNITSKATKPQQSASLTTSSSFTPSTLTGELKGWVL
ncbi:hypothetical protein N0V88_001202 [Collariella sp. IMI 366227]|nr:hypothetical protein N0V88_001202 [Collariella sp. IMI 366227]